MFSDNVILGKRLRVKGSPAVGVPRQDKANTSTTSEPDNIDNQGTQISSLMIS